MAVFCAMALGRAALQRLPLRRFDYEAFALRASSSVIGVSAAYWTLERLFAL